jgi:hypothetical protein
MPLADRITAEKENQKIVQVLTKQQQQQKIDEPTLPVPVPVRRALFTPRSDTEETLITNRIKHTQRLDAEDVKFV